MTLMTLAGMTGSLVRARDALRRDGPHQKGFCGTLDGSESRYAPCSLLPIAVAAKRSVSRSCGQRLLREIVDRAPSQRRTMGRQSGAGPIGTLPGIGIGIPAFHDGADKLMDQMRMNPAEATPLSERQMLVFASIVGAAGRKGADRLRQQVGKIGHRHLLRNLGLRNFGRVEHRLLTLAQLPLKTPCRTVNIKCSRSCRAVSKSERTIRATTSLFRSVTCALSIANGEPYLPTSASRIRPEPKQLTSLASRRSSARHGPTQCVASCIGGRPGQ